MTWKVFTCSFFHIKSCGFYHSAALQTPFSPRFAVLFKISISLLALSGHSSQSAALKALYGVKAASSESRAAVCCLETGVSHQSFNRYRKFLSFFGVARLLGQDQVVPGFSFGARRPTVAPGGHLERNGPSLSRHVGRQGGNLEGCRRKGWEGKPGNLVKWWLQRGTWTFSCPCPYKYDAVC